MERTRLSSLLVIALLQLSQTDVSSTLPESWYAANVINDGVYSPKPLSEIFSTETTMTERPMTVTEVSVVPLLTKRPPPPPPPSPQPAIWVSPQSPSVSTVTATIRPPLPPLPPQPPQLPELPQFQQTPPTAPPLIVSTPQGIPIQTATQGSPVLPQLLQNQPPNYFLLYQQLSQSVQNHPTNPPQLPSSSLPPVITSTTLPPSIKTNTFPYTDYTDYSSYTNHAPCATNTPSVPHANSQYPTFKIHMVAPSGSVTNVRINPNPNDHTTTTKSHRRHRNNYDGCVDGCGEKRVPICASPLGVSPINPDTLKGFPSVCHMACNNSFRKNLFEKVMDGKCGKLRTRIRPIDSHDKLKRDELHRASYTIVQDGPGVLEFSPLPHTHTHHTHT